MTEKLKEAVDYLSDNEARNLLMTILSGVDVLDKQQFFDRIKNIQEELLNEFQNQSEQQVGNYHTVHFTFSRSTSGSLNRALQQIKKDQEEKVIALADLFSVGPIGRLQKQSGFIQRYAWLQDHLHHYIEELDDFFNYYTITLLAINRISEHIRIVIWSGDNAHEQTGLAYLLYLLKEKRNDIYIMDAPHVFNKQTNNSECKHTSRVPFEAYQELLPSTYELRPLTNDLRLEYESVWEQLTSTDEKLRIMQNGKIRSVVEDYYDEFIMQSAKKLHREMQDGEFIKAARLIGEVIGHLDEYVGDAFIEYRIKHLISKGFFEIECNTKAMRFFSVKVKE